MTDDPKSPADEKPLAPAPAETAQVADVLDGLPLAGVIGGLAGAAIGWLTTPTTAPKAERDGAVVGGAFLGSRFGLLLWKVPLALVNRTVDAISIIVKRPATYDLHLARPPDGRTNPLDHLRAAPGADLSADLTFGLGEKKS